MLYAGVSVFQSCEVMAAASVNRPGSAQTTEKSQLILKGNSILFPVSMTYDVRKKIFWAGELKIPVLQMARLRMRINCKIKISDIKQNFSGGGGVKFLGVNYL